jgi:hypothetical protein
MPGRKLEICGALFIGALLAFTVSIAYGLSGDRSSSDKDTDKRLQLYLKVLREHGQEPVRFVLAKLASHDLIIFDDVWHTALEPWEFYQQLIRDKAFQQQAPTIFLETIPSNKQGHLDAYLDAAGDDPRLLYPAFQDDRNGRGWSLQTYFDLLRTVRTVNQTLDSKSKLRVFGVGSPTYWSEIQTRQALDGFYKSASGDYHMYATILNELAEFKVNRKGIFLTNTRHAHKGIRRKDGRFFWNAATFFHQWYPGKAYSIRVHSLILQEVPISATDAPSTAGGKEEPSVVRTATIEYRTVRMARGLWDSAFRAAGDRPVAFQIEGNVFGEEPYIGNNQLDALPNQKMQDAFDAVIFLAPIEKLRQSAEAICIYTPAFMQELKRRYGLMYSEAQLEELFKKTRTKNLDGFFVFMRMTLMARTLMPSTVQPLLQAQGIGPIDEWKTRLRK